VTSGGPNIQEVDKLTEAHFRHGPLSTEAECDEWIASTFRKLPDGALASCTVCFTTATA